MESKRLESGLNEDQDVKNLNLKITQSMPLKQGTVLFKTLQPEESKGLKIDTLTANATPDATPDVTPEPSERGDQEGSATKPSNRRRRKKAKGLDP